MGVVEPFNSNKNNGEFDFKEFDCEFFYLPALYLASFEELAETIQTVPNEIKHLAIVGHNPGLSQLASFLLAKENPQFPMNTMELLSFDIEENFGLLNLVAESFSCKEAYHEA